MKAFLDSAPIPESPSPSPVPSEPPIHVHDILSIADQTGYYSDASSDDEDDPDDSEHEDASTASSSTSRLPAVPPLKRQKLDIPYRQAHLLKQDKALEDWVTALNAINRLIKSKKTVFIGGPEGLQARRARTIQSHLALIVKLKRFSIDASERAAEANGFARKWGGRSVRSWTRTWVRTQELPVSAQGRHAKVYSLLDDPNVAAELRTYVRSNKWAMNPTKLEELSQNKLIPMAAAAYAQEIVCQKIPHGLKKYMELELFPRVHLKVGRRISLRTARRWLHCEGFRFIGHQKAKSWVFQDQHALRKKGAGRGLHCSDVICSTIGWLSDAGEQLEYGKNYDGYWDGQMFCKQLKEKIIPAFEHAHPSNYQALIMVDNSQGHAAYSPDALLVSRMNVNPGGKQARLRNGWYMKGGVYVPQSMIYPANHQEHSNQPKGIKAKYLWDNCDYSFDTLKKNMPLALASVQLSTICLWEHRMYRWMDAYRGGLGTQEAQIQVKKFSSTKYKSH
ncbi:hypothetical protein C8J56DRAFT_801145 [Mycena floridula]|nr:hypothetical protein C8J56DRAFT_801145 [Mycena floridula]